MILNVGSMVDVMKGLVSVKQATREGVVIFLIRWCWLWTWAVYGGICQCQPHSIGDHCEDTMPASLIDAGIITEQYRVGRLDGAFLVP